MAKKKKFLITVTNYGATRRFPYKGQFYEISKGRSIPTDDRLLAKEFAKFQFVDVTVKAVEQPVVKSSKKKKKASKNKKKAAA